MKSSSICLLSKASKNKSWLWHRRLNHLNFGTINDLAKKDLVRGLPRLKFEKDHLCSACQLGKIKKHTHSPKTENTNLEVLNTLHMDLFPRIPQQNGIVKRWNRTLVEAARTMLIFSKALMFLWVEVVATAFFGALCYPTNDSEDLGKLQPTTDIGIFVGYAPSKKGLVPNPVPTAPYVPPTNKELEILFQPMFDEYLEPPRVERPVPPAPVIHVPVNSVGTPSSTSIDQDAPFASHSSSSSELQSPCSHQGVAAGSTIIEDNPFAPVDNDPFVNVFAPKPSSEASSSRWMSRTAFLNDELKEEVYVSQQRLCCPRSPTHVYHLKKALYSLKQAPRAWYDTLSRFLLDNNFSKAAVDPTLFTQKTGKHILPVQIYVDDIIFALTDPERFKLSQNPGGIFINQSKFALEILKNFGMDSCDHIDTPMVDRHKLDEDPLGIPVDQTRFSRSMGRILLGTINWGLWYSKDIAMALTVYADANHAGCQDTRRSTSGSAQFLGDKSITLDESHNKSFSDYGFAFNKIPLYCDNRSAIALCCNNVQHSRSKHIDIRHHLIREQVEKGVVELYFVTMDY
ncbi:retrovirus-related pol polyprotein from transposon TNT 1-94 [Tanacetum coccineum]